MSDIRFNRWLHQSGTGGVSQDSSGNIGIGTTVPIMALDIRGDVNIGDTININNASGIISATTLTATTGTFSGNVSAVDATFTGNVTIGGTLTYEDVSNIDAVGIITAQSDIIVGGGLTVTGISTFNNDVKLLDNDKLKFGIGEDLQIYHNGAHSYLEETGTGALKLKGNDVRIENTSSRNIFKTVGTACELYFDDGSTSSKKLETTNAGAIVTGILTATTFNGNLTGNVTGDLTGNLAGITSIASISSSISDTAIDVFVYDTRKDSDGGAWRKRTQNTSWYNETLGTATRGTRKEFPAVAVIVCGTDGSEGYVHIYDGDDPDLPMWMEFSGGNTAFLYTTPTSVVAMNGMIFVGTPTYGLPRYDFIGDTIGRYRAGSYQGYKSPTSIENRDVAVSGTINAPPFDTAALVNDNINDVAMTVLPNAPIDSATGLPIPTIAVATEGGTSVIKDDGTVIDFSGFAPVTTVHIDADNVIGTSNSGTPTHDFIFKTHIPPSDEAFTGGITAGSKNYYMNSNSGTIPLLRDLDMSDSTYDSKDDVTYRGGNAGFDIIIPGVNYSQTHSNPAIAYIASDYNTGYMIGDIKGVFLSDTDTTNVTSSNLISGAVYSASDRITSYSYTNGSSTLVITDNPANADGYVNLALNGLTASTTYVLTLTANQTYTPTAGYNCHIGTTADGTVYFEDNFTGTASQNITFKSASSGSPTLVLYSNYNGALTYTLDLRLAEFDRSVGSLSAWDAGQSSAIGQKKGLAVYGTITKSAVATGADLVAYSGFSATNNLVQPYNSGLNFGTGDFSFIAWIKKATLSTNHYVLDRNDGSGETDRFSFMINAAGKLNLYSGSTNAQAESAAIFAGSSAWRMVMVKRVGGAITFGLDGKEYTSTTTVGNWSTTNLTGSGNENLFIGQYGGGTPGNATFNVDYGIGEIANVRLSASAPSAEQFKKMYEDEKCLFHENAKATLYGSSDAVTALAFDDTTNLLHAGTSAGRSEFQGLRRINNTTDAVTTAISASNGLVAEQ